MEVDVCALLIVLMILDMCVMFAGLLWGVMMESDRGLKVFGGSVIGMMVLSFLYAMSESLPFGDVVLFTI